MPHSVPVAMRVQQVVLIGSMLLASWLGMQAIHEGGHVLGAWLTGGRVAQVVLHPATISRTDLAENPRPLFVAWAGPVVGVVVPLLLWGIAAVAGARWAWTLQFFAGFCLLANGLYIGVGSFAGIGDSGDLLRAGAAMWHLWLFGAFAAPLGLWLWRRLGRRFGLGSARGRVRADVTYGSLVISLALLALAFAVGGE